MNKFHCFIKDLASGVHAGWMVSDSGSLKVYLTNHKPDLKHTVKNDLPEINMSNEIKHGGCANVQSHSTYSSGVITVKGEDVFYESSGGKVGPFGYVVLFNDAAVGDPLVGYWDVQKNGPVTLYHGDTFKLDLSTLLIHT